MSGPTRQHDDENRDRTIPDKAAGPDSFDAGFPEPAGTFVGRYQIKRQIASGGMGVVYEAVQEQPRRSVALKLMRAGLGSRAAVRRFETEAQLLGRLHHPHIAQVYEAGTHVAGAISVPYFAMEYIAGARSIDSYANANQLETIERLKLFALVCDAVHYGHTRGIIHRDLKPQNVLVGADGVLKVIDFGVARATDADLTSATLQTNAGAVIGTPQYCSPEQFEGDPNALDERTDVYSLGILAYELLTGQLPYAFDSQALPEVARIVCTQPPKPPSKVNRDLNRDIDAVLLTALQKQRTRRFPDAAALAADVRSLIDGKPISTLAGTKRLVNVARVRSMLARHPAGTAMVVMLVSWVLSYWLALPLIYFATPLDRWIQSRIVSLVPYGDPDKELQSVKIVTINDNTDLDGISADLGLSGLSAKNLQSQRRLLGKLLEKLATTNVRLVVIDMWFRVPSNEFDPDFIAGIRKFKSRGGQVVIGTRDWWIGADDSKLVAPAIKSEVSVGCVGAGIQADAPWALELFVEHPNADAIPSLSLAAFAQFRHPGAAFSLRPLQPLEAVELRYRAPTTQSLMPVVVGSLDTVDVSTLRAERSASSRAGVEKDDKIGRFVVPLPSTKALDNSTLEIGQVLRAPTAELWGMIEDRPVVLVGSKRSAANDLHRYVDGRSMYGLHAQAMGLDMLLRGDVIREPRRFHNWSLVWLGVVLGVGIARICKVRWQIVTLGVVIGISVLATIALYRSGWLADPITCLLPMLIAYGAMLAIRPLARTIR